MKHIITLSHNVLCVQAVKLIEDVHLQNETEEDMWKQALTKLYLNLSLCFLRQKKAERAAVLCRKALDLDQNSVKAHYRLGQVYKFAGTWGILQRLAINISVVG